MNDTSQHASRTHYDPTQLVHDVYQLLLDRGLPVKRDGDFDAAVNGAEHILRFLGLEPVLPAGLSGYRNLDLDGQKSYNRRVHGD